MSAKARKKNRKAGEKDGVRREKGRTPSNEIRDRRDDVRDER